MTNSVDPDQIALERAVWSGSTLFTQTCINPKNSATRKIAVTTLKFEQGGFTIE